MQFFKDIELSFIHPEFSQRFLLTHRLKQDAPSPYRFIEIKPIIYPPGEYLKGGVNLT